MTIHLRNYRKLQPQINEAMPRDGLQDCEIEKEEEKVEELLSPVK